MEWNSTIIKGFDSGHLSAAQSAAAGYLDALRAHTHSCGNRFLHSASETDPLFNLASDAVANQLSIEFWTTNLLDIDVDLFLGYMLEFVPELVHLGAFTANHNAGSGSVNRNRGLIGRSLDFNLRDSSPREPTLDVSTKHLIFLKQPGHILVGILVGLPGLDYTETKSDWMRFLTHVVNSCFWPPVVVSTR